MEDPHNPNRRLREALREAVQFIRDYPLGVMDRHYEQRRNRILCSEIVRDWLAAEARGPEVRDGD